MNISQFRKDISKHFNDAVQGRSVFVIRAGQMFRLEAYKAHTNAKASSLDDKLDELSIWIEANRDVPPAIWENEIWPEIKQRILEIR